MAAPAARSYRREREGKSLTQMKKIRLKVIRARYYKKREPRNDKGL
jgi:hypothetical protein